ncbi:MAG: hydroxymethylbilane synthase [Anaerolineales bacterium]
MPEVRIGSRGSALARRQTDWVLTQLQQRWPDLKCRVEYFSAAGDRAADRPLPKFGEQGVFTGDLAHALQDRKIDLAVHSLKDLPVDETPGLTLAAICERADAHDALVVADPPAPGVSAYTLTTLPAHARVGTSSLRRSAQLLAARPDLDVLPIRGNIDTRIRKTLEGQYDAILLAVAGLARLGLEHHIVEILPFDVMLPAPGQGALAVQCRADDVALVERLAALDHLPTRKGVSAERAFLKALGGGCQAPIAAYGRVTAQGELKLCGLALSPDGQQAIHVFNKGDDPQKLGAALAQEAFDMGVAALLP